MLRASLVAILGLAALAAPALAHHSYSNYDMQAELFLKGTVERVEWVNPHILIWLRTPDQDSAARIEGHAPLMLSRNGFERGSIKPGDQLRVTFHPLREGVGGSLVGFTLADNRSFDRFGVLQR